MSMIKVYKKCINKTNSYRIKNCPWFYFFSKQKSLSANRPMPFSFMKKYDNPGSPDYKEIIEEYELSEWYEPDTKDNTFMFFYVAEKM